jgi:hypothetical protein
MLWFLIAVFGGIPLLVLVWFIIWTIPGSRSRLTTRVFENPAFKEQRCSSCTYGAQYIHPIKGRIPIPRHLRMVVRGQYSMGSPQANIVKCSDCGGIGWQSTRIPNVIDTGYQELT